MRADQTRAEAKLWSRLRSRKLDGFKFRRQFPMEPFVVDFCCIDAKLVVELDGPHHAASLEYDATLTRLIETCGFQVLRFWNEEVMKDIDAVTESIRRALHAGSFYSPHPVR